MAFDPTLNHDPELRNLHKETGVEIDPTLSNKEISPEEREEKKDQGMLPDGPGEFVKETGKAVVGGAADAVESVGRFAELSGDTLKTGLNKLFGRQTLNSQNPFENDYQAGDANWLDIPDHYVPENQSGYGKLARGLVEFGLLAYATGGVGGYTAGAAKVGTRLAATARVAGIGRKGVRTIKFLHKGAVIGAEGGVADLISTSSESGNIANLVNEHAPWIPFSEALAVDPEEDSAWVSRIKTVAAGAGMNIVGHVLAGYVKGAYTAVKARKAGASIDEANAVANKTMDDYVQLELDLDENAATEMALVRFSEGSGISHVDPRERYLRQYLDEEEIARYTDPNTSQADRAGLEALAEDLGKADGNPWDIELGRSYKELQENRLDDPFVNPEKWDANERSTFRADTDDPLLQNLRESVSDLRRGGVGHSSSPLFTESALKRMSRNNTQTANYIRKLSKGLAQKVFKEDLDSALSFKEVQALIIRQADEMYGLIEPGGEQAVKNLKKYFKDGKDGIEYVHDGNSIVTGNASQKMALQLLVNTLTKQASDIAQSAKGLPPRVPLLRQLDQVHDLLKVALTEHKKIGFMTGSELRYQKGDVLSPTMRANIERGLKEIDDSQNDFFAELNRLAKQGNWQLRRDLAELYELSGGLVRTTDDITRYLHAQITGGRMYGKTIPKRIRTELRSVFYNSILSSLKTPIKAITGTNLVALLRPFQAYLGAGMGGNKTEMILAAAQIDAMGKAFAEGFQMFKHNWDLGINRQTQTYAGRFDFEADVQAFKDLESYYSRYSIQGDQAAYGFINTIADWNNNPWMRYSQNCMGAGDALARTILGRFEMRMRAARAALESGVDLDNVRAVAAKTEEEFRNQIFKKGEYGEWVVSDKAARLAGDEAAMTKALEGNLEGFERISRIFGMRAFFPFARTGFNALNLAWAHTDLYKFSAKWHDIMNGENLIKYGIRDVDLPHAQAVMRGRLAMGRTVVGMSVIASMMGNMTGDYPADKETRDLWRINGIQPNSFKFGNTYVSYRDIEPFNTIFAFVANATAYQHVLGEDIFDDTIQKALWMTTSVIVDKSMLAGIEDLAHVMSPETGWGKLERTTGKYIRAHLPYSGLLAQIGNLTNANEVEASNLWETIWRRDAIAKGSLHPKYDILSKDRSGKTYLTPPNNPLLRFFNAISPVAVTVADNDPVKMALKEISFNLPEVMNEYKGVTLTSAEKSQLQRYMQMGNLRHQLTVLNRKNSWWRKEVDAYKGLGLRKADGYDLKQQRFYRVVQKAFIDAKKVAMKQMLAENQGFRTRFEERQRKATLSKAGNYPAISKTEQLLSMPK